MNYTTLFLDVGGVFLTNGWDHHMREKAAKLFDLDFMDMNTRHALTFDTYEIGRISLDIYLDRVIFYKPRPFARETFKEFMFAQSEALPQMIELLRGMKDRFGLKLVAVSNEGIELMRHRISRFKLKEFIDIFVCSGFVHLRKPDEAIYQLAWDVAQVTPGEVIYIDDRAMLVEIGSKLGMKAFQHKTPEETQNHLIKLLEG